MKYIVEESLSNFDAWSGGKDTKDELTEEQLSQVEDFIEELYPDDPPTQADINDILWFERDAIAQYLGFSDWEHLNQDEDDDDDEEDEEEEEEE